MALVREAARAALVREAVRAALVREAVQAALASISQPITTRTGMLHLNRTILGV